MCKIWTGICLITNCVVIVSAKVQNKIQQSNSEGSDPLIPGVIAGPSNVLHWHVSLRLKSLENVKFGNGHFCSGVMITSNIVLTVAHCIQGVRKSEIVIVKGSVTLAKKDNNRTEIYRVRKIFVHENYKKMTKMYDIALLEIRSKDISSKHFGSKISLASPDTILDLDNDIECQTSGWGATKSHDISETIKTVNAKLVESDVCNVTEPFIGKIQKGMLCAGNSKETGSSACIGDSGGSLVCHNVLVGLVSWGPETCGKENLPAVYTDVGFYQDWINLRMARTRAKSGNVGNCPGGFDDYMEDSSNTKNASIFLLHLNLLIFLLYFNTFR